MKCLLNMRSVVRCFLLFYVVPVYAQKERVELIGYGDMDKWMVRKVEESFVIGGNTKYLYEIASGDTLLHNTPYKNTDSPWATSSVMAKVSGVVKTSLTVSSKSGETVIVPVWKPGWRLARCWDCLIYGLWRVVRYF